MVEIPAILIPIARIASNIPDVGPAILLVVGEIFAIPREVLTVLPDVGPIAFGRISVAGLHVFTQAAPVLREIRAILNSVAPILTDVPGVLPDVAAILANVMIVAR